MTPVSRELREWGQIGLGAAAFGGLATFSKALSDLPPLAGPLQLGIAASVACLGMYFCITGRMAVRRPAQTGRSVPVLGARRVRLAGVILLLVAVVLVVTPPAEPRAFYFVKRLLMSMVGGLLASILIVLYRRRGAAGSECGGAAQ